MQTEPLRDWHALSTAEALACLDTAPQGLSETEAALRLQAHGPNSLPAPRGRSPLLRFLAQFHNALIYFLLASALAALLLGHAVDALVIVAVVVVNAVVGFIQEGRAEKALSGMESLISDKAHVVRGGLRESVDAATLVPGDVVMLEAGDRVPADLRLIRVRALAIEEAALTGESVAAEKGELPVAADTALAERSAMAYSGTLVARGQATGVVVATGTATEIGRISALLQSVPSLATPLLRQIDSFAAKLTAAISLGAAALFAFAVLVRGFDWVDALIAVVALAVGAIPEGLPAVITITLAIGVQRMAARKAVIRKLPAVETLGATSVICTDKTGTLTRNEMMVSRVMAGVHELRVEGSGYQPEGAITCRGGSDAAAAIAAAADIVRCGVLCNDAHLRRSDGIWTVTGDPMEGALIALARKAGIDEADLRGEWHRVDEIPFDASHRLMATLRRDAAGRSVVFIKGAPEAVLALGGSREDAEAWDLGTTRAADEGERVLGFAMRELPPATERLDFGLLQGATMLGLMGFIDPPREEARLAIAECRSAGIAVKMITGDHVGTALAIARQLALADTPRALTGTQIEAMSDAELAEAVPHTAVFARASPEHKLRIVRAQQSRGAIVAMTGDGVNDAPSLKQADVGTAMGVSGTQAAREAAEMVLLDDNFASIVAAVREGRTVYDNIRKVIAWTLPTNGGEGIAVILAILVGFALPMTATQILWINLVMTVTLGLVLAFEPPEPGIMTRPPRRRDAPLLSAFLLWRVLLVSVLFAAVLLAVFFGAQWAGDSLREARTMVVNMLVIAEIFYLFNVRYMHMRSLSHAGLQGTRAVLIAVGGAVIAQLAFTYAPPLQEVFDTAPLSIRDGAAMLAIGAAMFFLLEAEKTLMRKLGWFEELA
ncbi:HAD-IC family P-type ATPase [uncultured Novosphingobium sp.]|uniref:HAD-IC family P-type ATPase n=1 Tax=uncultured Novosphingobium sp. TaxID=292277 RepID=UPI0025921F3D|nr:HAD-IC family P-type ATPase [uncultured Novosphingobium sp.]